MNKVESLPFSLIEDYKWTILTLILIVAKITQRFTRKFERRKKIDNLLKEKTNHSDLK